jgi:hypothetical protein
MMILFTEQAFILFFWFAVVGEVAQSTDEQFEMDL